ncbi:MAG: VOC family protein [Pseudomonadota bacterium]
MSKAIVEHVNMTVSDPKKTAEMLCRLFDWKIRWHGAAMNGEGFTYHVGSEGSYLALYSGHVNNPAEESNYETVGGLNHVGILVDDINATEKRILAAGYKTQSHSDYEPGKRFYFHDGDNIEFEIVSYTS